MTLRVSSPKQLKGLSTSGMNASITKQIANALKESSNKNLVNKSTKNPYCEYPPKDPSLMLYRAIANEYGSYYTGKGLAVPELIVPGDTVEWRLDVALSKWKIAIEMDGWEFHGKHLSSFKKDRRKDKFLATMGWVVLRVTYSEVTNNMIGILNTIKKTIPHRIEGEAVIKPAGFVHNKLHSWVKI
tara:strand:- start:194 stop:751 length:558 start_codon:yes stop_codon:yes gene_type:complete